MKVRFGSCSLTDNGKTLEAPVSYQFLFDALRDFCFGFGFVCR